MFIQLKGWCFRLIQNDKLFAQHFDCASRHVRVHGGIGSCSDSACDFQHVFAAHAVSQGKGFLGVGIKHNLHDTCSITNIQKDNSAVITATINPATQCDGLVDVLASQDATKMTAHKF